MDANNTKIKRANGKRKTGAPIKKKCSLFDAVTTTIAAINAKVLAVAVIDAYAELQPEDFVSNDAGGQCNSLDAGPLTQSESIKLQK